MLDVKRSRNLPDTDRLSGLAAIIMLAYALSHWVNLPERQLAMQLPGFYLSVTFSARIILAVLVAGLTAAGADWLLRDHPASKGKSTIEHWLLPSLTSLVIGIPLYQLSFGVLWWSVFFIGGALLILVLVAEYIVVDPTDIRQGPASAGLTAVSFALFLILAIVLRSSGWRLFFLLPALVLAGGLVCLRTFHLRLQGIWKPLETGVVLIIIGQLAAALYYWPLSPISYGLGVLAPIYALTSLIARVEEGETARQALVEPGLALLFGWGVALWLR